MGEFDFEAEARAWVNWYRSHSVPPLPEHLAIEYERIDARARAEGEADGYRRGVEAAGACVERIWPDAAHAIRVALRFKMRPVAPSKPEGT